MEKCLCIGNEEFGDYTRMVIFEYRGKIIQADKCLVKELIYLIDNGINTIESCCGHNRIQGYIAVEEKDIEKMQKLGYKRYFNKNYPNNKQFFIPKYL